MKNTLISRLGNRASAQEDADKAIPETEESQVVPGTSLSKVGYASLLVVIGFIIGLLLFYNYDTIVKLVYHTGMLVFGIALALISAFSNQLPIKVVTGFMGICLIVGFVYLW